jgi:hypothetical protein
VHSNFFFFFFSILHILHILFYPVFHFALQQTELCNGLTD